MVDVQMDALRAFEEYALAFVPRLFKLGRHVRQMRDDARRDGHHFIEHGIHGQSVDAVQCREQDILFLEGGGDLRFEQVGIGQIRGAHAHAAHLVFIAGPDAATGGPDLLALFELVLAGLVQHLVVRHDEVGLRADLEAVRGDVHALPDEGIEFFHEHDGIKDDAVSDQADFAFV